MKRKKRKERDMGILNRLFGKEDKLGNPRFPPPHLELDPDTEKLATVALEIKGDAIICRIEPKGEIAAGTYIHSFCYNTRGDKLSKEMRSIGDLLEKRDAKGCITYALGKDCVLKPPEVSKVRIVLTDALICPW
jgi:hypothetical protein